MAKEYAAPADVGLLADADRLFQETGCEIIKDQRKIKVARVRANLAGKVRTLYLKRYNAFSWRISLGSLFRRSGALNALRGATLLSRARIAGAKPVAAVESRRSGMVTKSFFFSEEIARGETIDVFWRATLALPGGRDGFRRRRSFLGGLASLFRSLHAQRVYHGDLKDVNIMVVAGEPGHADCFFLLDLEGIQRYGRLSRKRRVKNLVQLNRTFGRYVRSADKMYFLKKYLAGAFSDPQEKRLWAMQILGRSSRLDRRKFASDTVSV
ncbi:MAG: lipopolysaccharide kinase InaA family protein [Deltaproteobacteria bacterium]|nr:lipopolysaccharide kinase InaA family protein [Deltaproteobacteria bacterium]MDZ4347270.1 lipopolysaccharide kinase InaA family protein [Candidatus Binatia bacterium]